MRLRHPDGTVVHLAYGTNVLPAEDVDGIIDQVGRFGDRLRAHLGVERVGLGMWLPAQAAARLAAEPDQADRLGRALERHGVEVVTLNAFPYAAFQGPVVKHAVYHPRWDEEARLRFTLDAAAVLARLMPDDAARGSISTLPLAWHEPWSDDQQDAAMRHLDLLAEGLARIEAETGRTIRVGVEPEPGCVVETTAEAVERLAGVDRDRIGICLDLCHLAVEHESPADAVARLSAAGLDVVKTQPAAALVVDDPADPATRDALAAYAEDRFLHQVRRPGAAEGDHPPGSDDLPAALDADETDGAAGGWRVHFHVPLHAAPAAPLRHSREQLTEGLAALLGGERALVDHLEVETYTWSVLPSGPPAGDDDLARGLAAELACVRDELLALGLQEIS